MTYFLITIVDQLQKPKAAPARKDTTLLGENYI